MSAVIFAVVLVLMLLFAFYEASRMPEDFTDFNDTARIVRYAVDNRVPMARVLQLHKNKFTPLQYLKLADRYKSTGNLNSVHVSLLQN